MYLSLVTFIIEPSLNFLLRYSKPNLYNFYNALLKDVNLFSTHLGENEVHIKKLFKSKSNLTKTVCQTNFGKF